MLFHRALFSNVQLLIVNRKTDSEKYFREKKWIKLNDMENVKFDLLTTVLCFFPRNYSTIMSSLLVPRISPYPLLCFPHSADTPAKSVFILSSLSASPLNYQFHCLKCFMAFGSSHSVCKRT